MGIKHVFVSGKSDSADTSLVRPSNWNDDHTIDGNVDPDTNDAYSLGSSGTAWSDLFLGDAGEIDWNAGEVRLYNLNTNLYADFTNVPDGSYPSITVYNDDAGSTSSGFSVRQFSASPAANDELAFFSVVGKDSGGNNTEYGGLSFFINSPTDTSEEGVFFGRVVTGGSQYTNVWRTQGGLFGPGSDDGATLGSSTYQWSNLYLADGGRIYFDSDDGINHLAASGSVVISADDANTLSGSFIRFAVDGSNRLLIRDTIIEPVTNDQLALGNGTKAFTDLFLADGGVINWGNNDANITHVAAGGGITYNVDPGNADATYARHLFATNGTSRFYIDDVGVYPATNNNLTLGAASVAWSDLYLGDGAVIDWGNGGLTATHNATGDTLVVDSGGNRISLGDTTDQPQSAANSFSYRSDQSGIRMTLTCENSSVYGPYITTYHKQGTGTTGTSGGFFAWQDNTVGTAYYLGGTLVSADNATAGSYETSLNLQSRQSGSMRDSLVIDDVGTTLNHHDSVSYQQYLSITAHNNGTGGAGLRMNHDSASPAIGDLVSYIQANGDNSTGTVRSYGGIDFYILDETNGTEDSDFNLITYLAGSRSNALIAAGGIYGQGATGGDKGRGRANFTAVYDDNTLLTCYVDEAAQNGAIDFEKWDAFADLDGSHVELLDGPKPKHFGARKMAEKLGTKYDPTKLSCQKEHLKDKKHLTPYPNPDKFTEENRPSIGGWVQRGVEMDELLFQYIMELEARVAALEI